MGVTAFKSRVHEATSTLHGAMEKISSGPLLPSDSCPPQACLPLGSCATTHRGRDTGEISDSPFLILQKSISTSEALALASRYLSIASIHLFRAGLPLEGSSWRQG